MAYYCCHQFGTPAEVAQTRGPHGMSWGFVHLTWFLEAGPGSPRLTGLDMGRPSNTPNLRFAFSLPGSDRHLRQILLQELLIVFLKSDRSHESASLSSSCLQASRKRPYWSYARARSPLEMASLSTRLNTCPSPSVPDRVSKIAL